MNIKNISSFYRKLALCFSLLIIGLFLYYKVIFYSYVLYDDLEYISNLIYNVTNFKNTVSWIFTGIVNNNWSPITLLSFVFDYLLYDKNFGGYHLTSLLLHCFNSIIVFLILSILLQKDKYAYIIAIIFLVHPINVETVTWIAERKGVLGSFFSLGSIYFFLLYMEHSSKKLFYGISLFIFIFALLAKASSVTTPLIFLLITWFRYTTTGNEFKLSKHIYRIIPFLAASLSISVITIYVHNKTGALVANDIIDLSDRLLNANNSYIVYLKQAFYPFNLTIYYPYKIISIGLALTNIGLIIIIFFTTYLNRHKRPYIIFGFVWYTLLLLPVLGFIQTGDHAHADRYAYLPLIGIYIIMTLLVVELKKNTKLNPLFLKMVSVIFFLILMVITSLQYNTWRNNYNLFEHAYELDNENHIAVINLSRIFIKNNKISRGMIYYELARKLVPNSIQLYNIISHDLNNQGEYFLVIKVLTDLIEKNNVGPQVYINIAASQIKLHKYQNAISSLLKAKKLDNDNLELNYLLALSYFKNKNPAMAKIIILESNKVDTYSKKMKLLLEDIEKY